MLIVGVNGNTTWKVNLNYFRTKIGIPKTVNPIWSRLSDGNWNKNIIKTNNNNK